jgi:hypothetical protein
MKYVICSSALRRKYQRYRPIDRPSELQRTPAVKSSVEHETLPGQLRLRQFLIRSAGPRLKERASRNFSPGLLRLRVDFSEFAAASLRTPKRFSLPVSDVCGDARSVVPGGQVPFSMLRGVPHASAPAEWRANAFLTASTCAPLVPRDKRGLRCAASFRRHSLFWAVSV